MKIWQNGQWEEPCGDLVSDPLTPREKELLRWLGEGMSNPEIALQMMISITTVRTHLNNVYAKLQMLGPYRRGKLIVYGRDLVAKPRPQRKSQPKPKARRQRTRCRKSFSYRGR